MISIRIDEYTIKKHLFMLFSCLLFGVIAFVYLEGERLFQTALDARVAKEPLKMYVNNDYEFAVSYPESYLVGEQSDENGLDVYFTKQQDPPFFLKTSPVIYGLKADRSQYLDDLKGRKDSEVLSIRNIKVGDGIFAKEITSKMKDAAGTRLKETLIGHSGFLYVVAERYDGALDPAYPLLLQTFEFK